MACGPSTRDGDATEPARATEAAGRRPMIKATVARIGRTLYVFMFSSLGSVLLREAWLDILTISQEGRASPPSTCRDACSRTSLLAHPGTDSRRMATPYARAASILCHSAPLSILVPDATTAQPTQLGGFVVRGSTPLPRPDSHRTGPRS